MPGARAVLFAALGCFALLYLAVWIAALRADLRAGGGSGALAVRRPRGVELAIGFVSNFFDTLGIGSYAPTTSVYKLLKLVPDELIPGTLNVGDAAPTIAEALIFIAIISVEMRTLALMILAAVLGAWLGAGVVTSWPRRYIQVGMGIALLAAAVFFLMSNLGLFPLGGTALRLSGAALAVGLIGNFVLGALMTLGIGAYAPSMILVSLLGMDPKAAFPIMMGSCAFLMPVACLRFVGRRRYAPGPALGLSLGGVPAVLLAAYIVKSLPLVAVRWLVIVVVVCAAFAMLNSARRAAAAPAAAPAGE